jgi:mannose/cellobiose epimerase-like protein (N-acyl-D-glucosamine 2-epimerase family)
MYYGFAFGGLRDAALGHARVKGPAWVCDDDKYFWVQAESIATAARLGDWTWYDKLWSYAWRHFVDHEYGAWYRILDRENRKYSDEKSPAGKTDYHTMGACHDVLAVLRSHV